MKKKVLLILSILLLIISILLLVFSNWNKITGNVLTGESAANWCNGADITHDGAVNFADFGVLSSYYNKKCTSPSWCSNADINMDGSVNYADFSTLASNYNKAGCLGSLCVPINYDGGFASHVNLVFVPSNFNGNMALFKQKAEAVASTFKNFVPFNDVSKLNILYVPEESGSYCAFNCQGIARLLCCDTAKAKSISSKCTSGSRQTIVIHNDGTYGGAGYRYEEVATTSTHSSAPLIVVHELGHSLFDLGDEYDYYASTPFTSPNCDNSGCVKWDEMMGVWSVNCRSSRCAGLSYYSSENTIMYSLSYKFEEVNERISCCTYNRETGEFPAYCQKFTLVYPFDLDAMCMMISPAGAVPPDSENLSAPYEYSFIKNENNEWIFESKTQKRAGFYKSKKIKGDEKGKIEVDISFENKKAKKLKFEETTDVEYALNETSLGGYSKQERKTLTFLVDEKESKVSEIKINNNRAF